MITLKLDAVYKSLQPFDEIGLPNFTILTGINGAGKTHILKAISERKIQVTIDGKAIVITKYISNETLKPNDDSEITKDILEKECNDLFNAMANARNNQRFVLKGIDYSWVELLTSPQRYAIKHIERLSGKSHDEILIEDIYKYHPPITTGLNEIFNHKLSTLFTRYSDAKEKNELLEFQNHTYARDHKVLNNSEFLAVYGEPPWWSLNILLKDFNLPYELTFPSPPRGEVPFQTKLIHTITKSEVNFSDLSSGENIFMCLALALFNFKENKMQFPDLILMDEPDASLHPSMIKLFLSTIQDTLIKNYNVKILMVTHSPSTVVLAPDNSIYVVDPKEEQRLRKCTKQEALYTLTEGFVSLTEDFSGLGIAYGIKSSQQDVILLTEGITDKIILETAWRKLYNKDQNFYIQDCFDAGFLGNLLARGDEPSGIFKVYSGKKFIALFDFDDKGYSQWNINKNNNSPEKYYDVIENNEEKCLAKKHKSYNCHKLLLPVPKIEDIEKQVMDPEGSNYGSRSSLTIEMLFYDVDSLKNNFTEKNNPGGGKIKIFCGEKVKFANTVDKLSTDDFRHFIPLFDSIVSIIKSYEN